MDDNDGFGILFFILCLVIVVGCAIGLAYLLGQTYDVTVAVTATTWQRVIPVEQYQILHQDTLESSMPADAFNVDKYTATRYDLWKDKFVTDDRARYDVKRWVWDHDLTTQGGPRDERVWPEFKSDADLFVGALREGQRREIFTVQVVRKDSGKTEYLNLPDYQSWAKFSIEQYYTVEFNRLEKPQWETLKPVK